MRTSPPLLLPLFRSDSQAAILATLYLGAEELPLAQVAECAGVATATAHREVGRLLDAGLLREERVGNARVVSANHASPYYGPLRQLLETAFGPVPLLTEQLQRIRGVVGAAIFGSYAARTEGVPGTDPDDIDVVVIGDELDVDAVYAACRTVTAAVGREVRPVLATTDDWLRDSFFAQLRSQPMIELFDAAPAR